ncbi:MAG: SOS response-associated peptidase family protein [Burkholderiaceae bacterium]
MCGRYKLEEHWQEYVANPTLFDWNDPPYPFDNPFKGSEEVFPRNSMPVVRQHTDGLLRAELRQWGFIMMMKGKSLDADGKPKPVRRDVFNAMSEKLTDGFPWRFVFARKRCLIPMSSWDEWPETGAGKQRVRVSMSGERVFMAAGMYDENVDPKTGDKVPVYTMCTVPPNEFLGTVHDRAPMVLLPSQYLAWLAGGDEALALVGTHPDATAFAVTVV